MHGAVEPHQSLGIFIASQRNCAPGSGRSPAPRPSPAPLTCARNPRVFLRWAFRRNRVVPPVGLRGSLPLLGVTPSQLVHVAASSGPHRLEAEPTPLCGRSASSVQALAGAGPRFLRGCRNRAVDALRHVFVEPDYSTPSWVYGPRDGIWKSYGDLA